jgi:hypothetical protein
MGGVQGWLWRWKSEYDEGAYVKVDKFSESIMVISAIGKGHKSKPCAFLE